MITKTLSHYEIVAQIGEGGMGVVYRAVDSRLGRPVALKLLRPAGATSVESRNRFAHEARAASALNHPHIVTIYDIGRDGEFDFIAMEYVVGTSLAGVLGRSRLSIEDALKYALQIADALAAAHAAGILHRDLKPANIMVSDRGSIKVLDFGLAKLMEPVDFLSTDEPLTTGTARPGAYPQTREGTILGTADYMAPEQAEGKPADARSDVFSFGAVLYEMITGRRAFRGETRMATLAAVLTKEPEAPSRVVPGLSPELERIIVRCLRKNPERRWQSMADIKVALEDLLLESPLSGPAGSAISGSGSSGKRAFAIGLGVTLVAALIVGRWWWTTRTSPGAGSRAFLTRLTSDVGWMDHPAISLDGRFLAYASDRSGEANLDIWVQQVPDGAPARLTRHPADDVDPSFSADGSRVAFQSSRDGGGIYVIPTLGGEERLIAARGFSPRFSPDGNWIAYGVANERGQLHVAPAAGGPAREIAAGFHTAQSPVWSPDGRYLLFWGQRLRDAPPEGNIDWYVAPVPGGPPAPTQARGALLKEGYQAFKGLPFPDAWSRLGNRILFHGSVGDTSNLWQIGISRETRHIIGPPQRATSGTTDEAAASVTSDGRMVFISRTLGADLWSLAIDTNRATPVGPLKRVTQDAADDYDPTLSDNGVTLVYRSRRTGGFGVVMRNLDTGVETTLTRFTKDHHPAVSRDGTRVAYSIPQEGRMPIFVVAAAGGMPEQVCADCGEPAAWSADGTQILYVTARDPSGVGRLQPGGSHDNEWLSHPGYGIYNPRLSPDGGWIAFNGRTGRLAPAHVLVARVQGSVVASEKDWIEVSTDAEAPAWSPDATLLYFWSNRDGSPCLWTQRVDPTTKRPIGDPRSIQHFHNRGLSWRNLYLGAPAIAVARDKIVFNLGEQAGNIWMTELPRDWE